MERKLSAEEIVEYRSKETPNINVLGLKHFEPTGSAEEFLKIQNHLGSIKELISHQKVKKIGSLSQAVWHPELQKAEITNQIGSYWSTMGHTINQKLYLYPEEALYLLEVGALEITYNDTHMSLQRAYSTLLTPLTDVSEENYRVYSELNANGYKVLRHIQSNVLTKYEKQIEIHKAGIKVKNQSNTSKRIKSMDSVHHKNLSLKKLKMSDISEKFPQIYNGENEKECLQNLRIFGCFDDGEKSKLSIHYDIYLMSDEKMSFKKTSLQLPKFRVVVHRGGDVMPDWKEFGRLAQQFQDGVPIIHAIAFSEFISFYQISPVSTPICD